MRPSRLAICARLRRPRVAKVTHDHAAHHEHDAPAQPTTTPPSHVRTYYIAADEVTWDYAPAGRDLITGKPFDARASMWTVPGKHRLGSRYKKALYREYTDATFTKLKPRDRAGCISESWVRYCARASETRSKYIFATTLGAR